MELQVGVKILLKNQEGKYLLLRRNPKKYPDLGQQWDIVGGRINPGTTLLENLAREILEETKMTLVGVPKLVAAQDIIKLPDRHVVRLTYLGQAQGEPILDEEHNEHQWLNGEELKSFEGNLDKFFKELIENKIIIL